MGGTAKRGFSISEVEQLTGVKATVLRYWEEHVPFLSPQKDAFGRRSYTFRDVQIVTRLKFLVNTRNLSIEKACAVFLAEVSDEANADTIRQINLLKNELFDLYTTVLAQKGERRGLLAAARKKERSTGRKSVGKKDE